MAKKTVKTVANLIHPDFLAVLRTALDKKLDAEDLTTCVSSLSLAQMRDLQRASGVKKETILKVLVMAAARSGQLDGFEIRRGINGGIHRVEASKKRAKPKAKASSAAGQPVSAPRRKRNKPAVEATVASDSAAATETVAA